MSDARPSKSSSQFPYVWAWRQSPHRVFDRCRKGERCRVVCRGTMNSALIEFEDGYRVVTSRNGIRKASRFEKVIERGSADPCGLGDADFGDPALVSTAGQETDRLHGFVALALGGGAPVAVDGQVLQQVEVGLGLSVHDPSVKHLTNRGKRRKVLYMETTRNLTSADRRAIYAEQFGRALDNIKPNMGTRYSACQIAAAKGIASKRALAIISEITGEDWS